MAVPTGVLWDRDPHTEAKHILLRRYMAAWFPIMASQFSDSGFTFLDGFAGPGEYLNASESSPIIAMEQAHRAEVTRHRPATRLVLIEEKKSRAQHLEQLLAARFPASRRPSHLHVAVHHGDCNALFNDAISAAGGWSGPIFANLDGFGVDTSFEVVSRIASQRSSEVLVTFGDQFLKRFANVDEQQAGDRVFGDRGWRAVAQQPSRDKTPFLLDQYRSRLRAVGFPHVLTFEMVDEGGHGLFQIFGTTSEVAVAKFKDGLWEIDGVAGQRFRDPRNVDQLAFEMSDPDFAGLEIEFLNLLETHTAVDLETLCRHALLETIYKRTHAKPTIDRLVATEKVVQIRTGQAYSERIFELAPPKLF